MLLDVDGLHRCESGMHIPDSAPSYSDLRELSAALAVALSLLSAEQWERFSALRAASSGRALSPSPGVRPPQQLSDRRDLGS